MHLAEDELNAGGTIERALDGWDLRGDYHLPIDQDVNFLLVRLNLKTLKT